MSKSWVHNELQADLANHLHAGGGTLVWTNIVMGQAGAPRPDVLTLDAISWASLNFVAYEVKISVADFQSDTKSGKWQQYLAFAQGVTFAAPRGLVKLGDIPNAAGLVERGEAGWRWKKRPTLGTARLTNHQMIKLAREPVHRPAIPMATSDNDGYWRRERISGAEASAKRRAIAAVGERIGAKVARYLTDSDAADGVIADARKQAGEIVKRAREQAATEKQQVGEAWAEVAKVLGLEPTASLFTIQAAVRDAADRLTKDGEVAHLREQLDVVERALRKARPLAGLEDSSGARLSA